MKGPFSTVNGTFVGVGAPYAPVFALSKSSIHLKLISPTLRTVSSNLSAVKS